MRERPESQEVVFRVVFIFQMDSAGFRVRFSCPNVTLRKSCTASSQSRKLTWGFRRITNSVCKFYYEGAIA